ncbi:hypothetical protein FOZ63_029005, partial [Perkinsus olseni]
SGLDNIVIVGHHEASHLVEVRLAGNNDSKALGVLTAEPEKILSRVGLDCKLTMKYVVSAAYGLDYDPDELSLTALLGDMRQTQTLISFRVHTLPPGTRLQHVTLGSLEEETLQLDAKKSQGIFKSKASSAVVKQRSCSLRSTPGLRWQSYDKGQYKGSFLPLSKALTTERKNRYVVVFAFGDKTFPVPVEKILRTTGALNCEEAFIAAFHALYETKTSLRMETMTPYELMSDMERYLAAVLEGEKERKSNKRKELADVSEFPVRGRSTAQISTAIDNDIRVKNANRRASQRRREHAEVAQRESGLRPPSRVGNAPESSDSEGRTLKDTVEGLIPQRGTSEVKGLPESVWTCTPPNSQVVWSWPRKSFKLDNFPEKSEVVVISKGKVRLRFPFGREDLNGARHDGLLHTICRLTLEKAVAVRYKSKAKSLEEIALKKFEDDIRKKLKFHSYSSEGSPDMSPPSVGCLLVLLVIYVNGSSTSNNRPGEPPPPHLRRMGLNDELLRKALLTAKKGTEAAPSKVDTAPRPPRPSANPEDRSLEEVVKDLIPQRYVPRVEGLPEKVWRCAPNSSRITWSWPREGKYLDELSETSDGVLLKKGQLRLRFTFTIRDLHGAEGETLIKPICRSILERAVAARYGPDKKLSQVTLRELSHDLRSKSEKKVKQDELQLVPSIRAGKLPRLDDATARGGHQDEQQGSHPRPSTRPLLPDILAKSLAQTAQEAFGASECRAKNDAGQTLYWRLWYREDFYSYYRGDPLSLLKRQEAELTVAFLVDGREYGVDLNKEWAKRLKRLLLMEKIDEDVRADYNGTCKTILDAGQISLRKEFLPPARRRSGSDDYTLKQLRSDIALYERAIKAGKEDATFKFKDLEDIASEALTKKDTRSELSCYHPDVKFRWKVYRGKYTGPKSLVVWKNEAEKSARKRPRHDFVSFVYRVHKENDKYVDKYFTVSVGWEPESCERALEMGLERLFESHTITNLGAISRFTPIDVEARLKKVAETSETNKKFSPVFNLGEGAVTLGEPLSEIARRSLLFGVCFGFDDTAKLSWRLEDPKYFMGPLFNEKDNATDTIIVVTVEDSKEIPAFGLYAWEQYLYNDNQLSCSLMMETFVALAYKSPDYQSGSVSVLGLKGDLQKAMSDYVLARMQQGGVSSLSKAVRSLQHETLQLLGADADEAQARAESEVSVLLPVLLCSGKPRILSWVSTVGKGAREQREGTNVEIRLGDGRKLVLLISRDDFPEVQKCSTALRAAGSRLYVDFTMQMTKSELAFDISRYLTAINIAELEGRRKPKLDHKWSRGKAGTFEHTDYLRQKVYHPEHEPLLYSMDSQGLPYNKFLRSSRLLDVFPSDEVLEVSSVHTAVLPSSRKLAPSLKKKAPKAPESRKGSSAGDGLTQAMCVFDLELYISGVRNMSFIPRVINSKRELTPALSFLPMRALLAGLVISATCLVTARGGCFGGRCSDDSFRWEERGGQGDPVPTGAVKNAGGHRAARGQATQETKTASFFPNTKAKSLKLAARAAFIVFECRARAEGDQTLFWRLWRRDDFFHFYGWKPNILFERPDSDLTVTFLVDGIEYGVDLPRERSHYIETLLEGDEEMESDNPHICLTIMNDSKVSLKADGSGLVEEGGADYTLKQLRNDITLYQRALSRADKEARFEFRTLQWIGAHAVMKVSDYLAESVISKNTQKELSCFSEDVKFRWKAYRRKYTGPKSLVALRAASEEEPTGRKASASLKGFFVSLVYNFTRKKNEYEDRYFTARVPAHPRSCEHALELGLEYLYERTEPVERVWISNAFSRLTPIE